MYLRQISVFIENRRGQLADVTDFLCRNSINLRTLSIADTADFGVLRIVVQEPEKTFALLKEAGYTCVITDMLAVEMKDQPGAMAKIIRILADHDISIEYTYAFPTMKPGRAVLIFRVADNAAAETALADAGFHVVGQELLDESE